MYPQTIVTVLNTETMGTPYLGALDPRVQGWAVTLFVFYASLGTVARATARVQST